MTRIHVICEFTLEIYINLIKSLNIYCNLQPIKTISVARQCLYLAIGYLEITASFDHLVQGVNRLFCVVLGKDGAHLRNE